MVEKMPNQKDKNQWQVKKKLFQGIVQLEGHDSWKGLFLACDM